MSTNINIAVGDNALLDRARQQQSANRQAQLNREASTRLEAQATAARTTALATQGRDANGNPITGAFFTPTQIERRPAANRAPNNIWKSLLSQSPFVVYNGPLQIVDDGTAPSIGPGPVALGYFRAEGRTYQYIYSGSGRTQSTPEQSIISYQSGSVGPYLLSTFSGPSAIREANRAAIVLRRVIEYDTTDLQTLAVTEAVLNPLVPARRDFNFNTLSFNAWIGGTAAQALSGASSTFGYEFRAYARGVEPVPDFSIAVLATTERYFVFSTGNSTFVLPNTFTPTNPLTWINLKVELGNDGSTISLYTKTTVDGSYVLVGSQILANPIPKGLRSLDFVELEVTSIYPTGTIATPPPVAVGAIHATYS
jgi:hypothetical protein